MPLLASEAASSAPTPQAAYWRSQLAALAETSGFLPDFRPPAPPDSTPAADPDDSTGRHAATLAVPLGSTLTERLDRISRGRLEMLCVVLASALAALLGRCTGQEEVAVALPKRGAAARFAAGPLLVRTDPSGSLRQLLARVGDALREAERHQDCDVASLATELGRPGAFDTGLALDGFHEPGFVAPGVMVTVARRHGELSLTLAYATDRFAEESVRLVGAQYALLLEKATDEPDRPVHTIELWTAEDEKTVAAANSTERGFDTDATLHGLFAEQAARTPEAPALLTEDGTVTYGRLDARANQLARTLRERGIGPGSIVALLTERSPEMLTAVLAVLKAGAAYLPVDPAYPQARIDHLLTDSAAGLALHQSRFKALAGSTPALDIEDPASYAASAEPLRETGGAGDVAYVIYTSGSTGRPKGVLVEHRSAVNRLLWMQRAYPIGPDDVVLQKTSISFDVSVWELFWWSFTGAALALPAPGTEKDPAALLAAVEKHRVTTMHFVPSMLTMFLGHLDRFGGGAATRTLRQVFASGEALAPAHAVRFAELIPQAGLVNLYGPTEATVDVTHQPVAGLTGRARLPIGRPIDNVRLYVLDGEGRQAPVGVPGELYVAGVGVARGYLGRPELTAEKFVTGDAVRAATGEERLYRTGDRVRRLPDGSLDYLGRVDEQVKVRGFRVEPGEIEERLRTHPGVREAAVVAVDDGWQTSLRGFVVPSDATGQASEAELKEHLRAALPAYMVPGRIRVLDELPLTPNGKLDRAALRSPDALRKKAPAHVAPRNATEEALARIWREVLGLEKVGVHDNFFALGGNSIHFVSVLAKSREAGLDFTFQQLFRHQTIALLVASMEESGSAAGVPDVAARGAFRPFELIGPQDRELLPEDAEDAYPLSMLQAGLIFQTEITGGLGQYHDVLSYAVTGAFDAEAFTEAVRLLTLRHPILRTTYHLTGYSEFLQIVHREVEPPLTIEDLRHLDRAAQEAWHEEWLAREKARRFEWERGGLVTLHIQVLDDELYRYTVSQHNSALDGWSISLLHTQLFELYHQVREGRDTTVRPVDNHLRNFVGLETEALRSEGSRDFWREVMADPHPADVPRRPGAEETADFRVVLRDVPLPTGLTQRIEATADALSVPVKDVLLAAHMKVLSLVSGQRTVMTGYEHSGRPELPDAETTLGLHLNTVPFQVEVASGSWAELIRRVYRAELALLPHRRYPMAQMKQDLATQRQLFSTTFNFTHFYLLKNLRHLPEFSLLEMRVDSETEFPFRTEFSRSFVDDEVQLCLHYHTHLYDEEQIDRIGGYFVRVLELMAAEPDAPHEAHQFLAEEDLALLDGDAPAEGLSQPQSEPQAQQQPQPQPGASASRGSSASPATVARIRAAWQHVLDLPEEEIGEEDDFFALGGNSLSALRVVLELDGLVTLSDLTRLPRLGALAALVDSGGTVEGEEEELLQLLSSTAEGARAAVVCVPYPCGHPVNFKPLAEAVEKRTPDLAVYGLEPPGHSPSRPGRFTDVTETVERTLAQLEQRPELADLPLILWGHCGGAAVTVELARVLEERGFDLRQVFIGSKLLPSADEMRESIEMIESWSDGDIITYMVEETGYTEMDGLDRRYTSFMGDLFRHDVCGGYRYFIRLTENDPGRRIEAPFTVVVAGDDTGLAHAAEEYRCWERVADRVDFHRLGSGGHYFVRGNPAQTAELIERAWASAAELEG
ncbi:non-ribosomal peptide synthetase [Streptomyces sp. 891-h]|uniref:non-ribosomal peptide synthetase n=1 Tax=Streptomyces sp. 891-h TaxID=2720714 RepID=UPI001FAAD42D|nr:non-ribosomal peptide synthetase [Streptomyces sp. 891-h]UNZ16009.1 amino acid adenylation domain-containing protein [Streptomyces sp. 891-h]